MSDDLLPINTLISNRCGESVCGRRNWCDAAAIRTSPKACGGLKACAKATSKGTRH